MDKSSFDNYINHKEKNGFTALHYAIYNCSYELTKLLCNFGAKTNILSNQNESALDYAKKFKNEYSKILDCLNQNNSNKINIIYGKEVVSLNQNNNENNGTKSEEKIDKDIKIIDLNFKNEEINKNFSILEKSKPRGLKNINGSCYLNTVLQCLFHIKPLSMYFLKNINNFSNMPIAKAYSSVIFGLINQTSRNNAFEPEEFKRAMEKINPNYASFGNDPKDVIMDFLDNINHEILDEQDSFQYNNKLNKCDKFQLFNYYKKENERTKTIISDCFGWFLQTEKYCFSCRKKNYDFIFDFYFIFNLQKICGNNRNKNKIGLLDCFRGFFKTENKKFTCQNNLCIKENKNGRMFKKLCFLPKYLIIILDRGKDDKYDCNVDFDYDLELEEFTDQIENNYNTEYILLGATFLFGSSGAGHTIAFCRHFDNKYYIFNDSKTPYNENLKNIKNNKAFLLFYERKKNE